MDITTLNCSDRRLFITQETVRGVSDAHTFSRRAAFAAAPPDHMAPLKPPTPAKEEASHSPLIDVLGVLGGPDNRLRSGTLGANP